MPPGRRRPPRKAMAKASGGPAAAGRLFFRAALLAALFATLLGLLYRPTATAPPAHTSPQSMHESQSLPRVAAPSLSSTDALSTATFAKFTATINPSLVVFFDPRSESYLAMHEAIERAAAELLLGDDTVAVGSINCAVETLLCIMAVPQFQAGVEKTSPRPFQFGKLDKWPILVQLYHGNQTTEYDGTLSEGAQPLQEFVRRRTGSGEQPNPQEGTLLPWMSADNSWSMKDRDTAYLVILLVPEGGSSRAARAVSIVTEAQRSVADRQFRFVRSNGTEYGEEFGLSGEKRDLPGVVLHHLLSGASMAWVPAPGEDGVEVGGLWATRGDSAAVAGAKLANWLVRSTARVTDAVGKRQKAEAKARQGMEEEAGATAAIASVQRQAPEDFTSMAAGEAWRRMTLIWISVSEFVVGLKAKRLANKSVDEALRAVEAVFERAMFRRYTIENGLPNSAGELGEIWAAEGGRDGLRNAVEKADEAKFRWEQAWDEGVTSNKEKHAWGQALGEIERAMAAVIRSLESITVSEEGGEGGWVDIERRHESTLSLEEFVLRYELERRPVIITGLDLFAKDQVGAGWSLSHIKQKCGGKRALVRRRVVDSVNWGGLEAVEGTEELTVETFLDAHVANDPQSKEWYMHDWGLLPWCREILAGESGAFDELRIPKYFAGDYFQRLPYNRYQHSWPSLFVGANSTESALHVDSGGTNFFLFLVRGQKEWRFFDRDETPYLYPRVGTQHFDLDVFRPDLDKFPLYSVAKRRGYRAVQEKGELIYIPAGCPHAVRNLADITALSMNYLDPSNQFLFLWLKLMDADSASSQSQPN